MSGKGGAGKAAPGPDGRAAADAALARGEVGEAARLYREALAAKPEDVASIVGLARVAILIGTLDEAEKLVARALELAPGDRDALMYSGVVLEARGKLDEAIACYRAAVKGAFSREGVVEGEGGSSSPRGDAKSVLARFNLGRALGVAVKHDEAAAELRRATELAPQAYEIHYALGICEQERGDTGAAIEAFARAIEANPAHLDAYLTLADVLCFAQKFDAAAKLLEQAASLFPRSGLVEDKLAAVCFRAGDLKGTLQHLERQVDLEPDNAKAYLNLSTFAQMAGDMARAERAAERLAAIDATSWEARYHLGSIYEAVGLIDKAKKQLRAAVELAPKEWKPRNNLGLILIADEERRHIEEGATHLDEAAKLAPPDEPAPRFNLALARLALGENKKAASLLKDLLAKLPKGHRLEKQAREMLLATGQKTT